jgi:hypothetical protein
MLTPFDEYPTDQSPQPITRSAASHPDFYDRFWFNCFRVESATIRLPAVVRAPWGGQQGIGVPETVVVEPHYSSRLTRLLDGAPPDVDVAG